jgi:putative ABC transport system substrate-binding protein
VDLRRRQFLGVLGGAATVWPRATRAQQQPEGVRQVGVLLPFSETDAESRGHLDIFRKRLQELGWTENRNLRIAIRYGVGNTERIRNLAKELVALKPDVILGRSTPVAKSILLETKTIPTIFVVVSDPVGDGIVSSIARPGRNVTGFTNVEASLGGKWLEVLKEMSPTVGRAAVIFDPKTSPGGGLFYSRLIENAASLIPIRVVSTPVNDASEIERAIIAFAHEPNGGLIVLPDVTTGANRDLIIRLAATYGLPAVYSYRYITAEGGLASYGVDVGDLFRRAADYVDRVLRGDHPGDLPVQAPIKFDLVINLKTAKALHLTIPPMLLARADEVIE